MNTARCMLALSVLQLCAPLAQQLVDADNRAFADGASLTNPEGALSIERDVPARARTRSAW